MTTLDARASLVDFDMADTEMVSFATGVPSSSTQYAWVTPAPDMVYAFGGDITTDASGFPTGGTVTSIEIDLEADGNPSTNDKIDAFITPTAAVALTALVFPTTTTPAAATDLFWEALLSGNDLILAPDEGQGFLFGDFYEIHSGIFTTENKTGGDDVINAAPEGGGGLVLGALARGPGPSALVGDAYTVSGSVFNNFAFTGRLTGGDDTITLTKRPSYDLIGDAYVVGTLGAVVGGDDTIRSDASLTSFGFFRIGALVGDVYHNDGFVSGGEDLITGSSFAFLDEAISGDIFRHLGSGTGGADTIDGRAGNDYIAGDVAVMGGTLTGGADDIRGGEDSDILAGDALQVGASGPFGRLGALDTVVATLTGGNDTLLGQGGNDIIAGDAYTFGGLAAGSSIRGGRDGLFGGEGDDQLFGEVGPSGDSLMPATGIVTQGGNDTLNGGSGDDLLDGGLGADLMYGSTGNDTFVVDNAGDRVEESGVGVDSVLSSVGFTLRGSIEHLTLTGIAAIKGNGNGLANTIRGNDAANRLDGGAGADTLAGGLGNDIYIVDNAGDVVQETGVGIDIVSSLVTFSLLGQPLEILSLSGSAAIGGTGNGLGNTLFGNTGANRLDGGGGNDRLIGGLGKDTLLGGTGLDVFDYNVVADSAVGALRDRLPPGR